jgi:hypothetical protein
VLIGSVITRGGAAQLGKEQRGDTGDHEYDEVKVRTGFILRLIFLRTSKGPDTDSDRKTIRSLPAARAENPQNRNLFTVGERHLFNEINWLGDWNSNLD